MCTGCVSIQAVAIRPSEGGQLSDSARQTLQEGSKCAVCLGNGMESGHEEDGAMRLHGKEETRWVGETGGAMV